MTQVDSAPEELKSQWRKAHDEIFAFEAQGVEYVYRALSFAEYTEILAEVGPYATSVDIEDPIILRALLWPQNVDLDEMLPGVVAACVAEIKSVSACDGEVYRTKELLDLWRERMGGLRGQMKAFVVFAIPSLNPKQLDDITMYRLAEYVVLAEEIIAMKQSAEGIEVESPVRFIIQTPEEIAALEEELSRTKVSKYGNATANDPVAQKLLGAM